MPDVVEMRAVMAAAAIIILGLAVREDLIRHRIPNTLTVAGLVLGLGFGIIAGGLSGFVSSAGGGLVGCAVLLPFYLLRGMAAGDVKLMGAAGTFLGPSGALLAAALALVAGSVLAVAIVAWRMIEPRALLEAPPSGMAGAAWRAAATVSVVRKERFSYAVAIAAGVVATLHLRGSLGALLAALGLG
jgi:prepilin peptidase CpaA